MLEDISKHHEIPTEPQKINNFVTDLPPIKHDLGIHSNNKPIPDYDPELDLTTIPKPLLFPVEPHATLVNIPGKPASVYPNTKYEYSINNSIKKVSLGQAWKNKYQGPVGPGPPLQPYHLAGRPGAWNIVTSKPGSLPPPIHVYQSKFPTTKPVIPHHAGIDLQYGPKFPPNLLPQHGQLQTPNPFPARRRPSTGGNLPPLWPRHPGDMNYAGSEATLAVAGQPSTAENLSPPATERTDVLREEDIIIIDNSASAKQKQVNTTQQPITNDDILLDDQLAIFKVGPDNVVEQIVNMSGFDQNVTNSELTKYKYVILHKLPNGEALNLENLKTYNYEDLTNDYKNQFSEEGPASEEFDRENLEYFDVPRRFSENHTPYIIYQLNDAASKASKELQPNKFKPASQRVRPVYRPTTERVTNTPNTYIFTPTRKGPVFVPQRTNPPVASVEGENLPLSRDDMKLLQTKVEEILSKPSHKNPHGQLPNYPRVRRPPSAAQRPPHAGNDWIPTDYKETPRHGPHLQPRVSEEAFLDVQRLSKLSHLASVSITDAGSLAETVKSLRAKSHGRPGGPLTIQLLPPRLSAVLTHLEKPPVRILD